MLTIATFFLTCLAAFLELANRAPVIE